jgi:Arc/MetJ family transcription regulator
LCPLALCVRLCVGGGNVPTNLALDDALLNSALKVGGHRTKRETANEALREYVLRRKRRSLVKLFGMIDFRPDWDHKKARRRP